MAFAFSKIMLWVGVAFVAMSAMGCHHDDEFRSFDTISISLDPQYRDANGNPVRVEVDLIAVNEAQLDTFNNTPVTQYFDSKRDASSTIEMTLGVGNTSQTISVNDPDKAKAKSAQLLWTDWEKKGLKYLVVLADYPLPPAGTPADKDWRRKVIPLMWANWTSDQREIKVMVTSQGLSPLTSWKASPPK